MWAPGRMGRPACAADVFACSASLFARLHTVYHYSLVMETAVAAETPIRFRLRIRTMFVVREADAEVVFPQNCGG